MSGASLLRECPFVALRDIARSRIEVRFRCKSGHTADITAMTGFDQPFLPVILTSGHPRERVGELPPGVAYMPKPWQPLKVLIAAE